MKKRFLLISVLFLLVHSAIAQNKMISGVVLEKGTNEPLPGVTILEKGTAHGTVTNNDGKFTLSIAPGTTLVISFVGMKPQEISTDGSDSFKIFMEPSTEKIDDVVVTALGIKREKKALGYSVQDVKGDEIAETNPVNVVSALSGKIAGAEVVTSSGQLGASSTIKIRGNKSFTGSAEPLFVVDGTPIMNSISSSMSSTTYTDFGNAAMDIDPSNIASISVLKGASAAALYGSRAANGVILITTKKGMKHKGIGVELNSSSSISNVYILPNYQNEYGQGRNGSEYEWKTNYPDLSYQAFHDLREFRWSLTGNGYRMDWDESWGSRLDAGLMVAQMDSPLDSNGNPIPTPWVSHPDNVKNFFNTGVTWDNSVALYSGNDIASGRLTLSHVKQTGTVPNTDQEKTSVGFNSKVKLSDKLSFETNVNYTELNNGNIPQQGNSMRNPLVELNSWFGRQVNMKYLKEHYQDIVNYNGELKAFNWMMAYDGQHNNPYWLAYKNTMSRNRKRAYGNVAVTYSILPGVDLTGRLGTDFFNEHRKYKYHQYSRDWTDLYTNATNGTFWEQYRFESETNADLLLKINKQLTKDLSLFSTVGANYRFVDDHYATTSGTNLVVPDFFSTSNIEGEPNVDFTKYSKKTYSVFGSANLGYKSVLFLDLTLRGDWSSTLPEKNWNFWYPSANLGFIFTDALKIKSKALSYGKLRLGYAQVGNDTDPYQLTSTFSSIGTSFNGVNLFSQSSVIPTFNLKPEETRSYEIGGEFKFLNNRLGLDATYYIAKTFNQLLSVDIPYSSGYSSWMKNAGSIQNSGVELQFYATPVSTSNFKWDMTLNWSTNKNKIIALDDGLEELQINSLYRGTSLMAFPGKEWGALYGTTFARNSEGKILIDENGMPVTSTEDQVLGYVNPDWTGGFRNTFSYQAFTLSALLDFRKGGDIFSMTKAVGQDTGILEATVKDGIRENGMIVDGVYRDGTSINGTDVSGQTNTTRISARSYWRSSRNWAELSIIDGSFVKLREVTLTYTFPHSFLNKISIENASFSLYGHNLALLYTDKSNDVHIDPEVSSGGTVAGTGFESYQMPPVRTLGCKLNVKF
ncbi:SusC/RagA family TonB-linked outer membrane protein [Prolixibacter sp. NT017]|uniref:SusC/RagA family TonB-linked outer membrane protein n=1 Tax=Prolixibacter sp. NT017 TaxID=2652390 RepID=UPI001298F86F|nr:SusC/RagA family TonB-linked outer membrane protein [Prolixibacter sp. NT017]